MPIDSYLHLSNGKQAGGGLALNFWIIPAFQMALSD